MTPWTPARCDVAIVGAGPAGLVAAIAGRKLGLDVALFEQASEITRVGGGIALHSNGLRVLDALDLLDGFEHLVHPLERATIESPDGRVLTALDYRTLAIPQNRIAVALRADLQAHLFAAAQRAGVSVSLGRRCTAIEPTGTGIGLRLAGATEEADVVVGADGIRSVVREALGLQARCRPTGEAALRGVSPRQLARPMIREVWLPDGRRFGVAPLPRGRTYFYCSVPLGQWPEIRARGLSEWIESWRQHVPDVIDLLGAVRDWDAVSYDELQDVTLGRWRRGPGFLVGDAAHAMTPDLGQGANSAMVDGLVLMRLLGASDDLDEVGRRYQRLRRLFVRRLQLASRQVSRLASWSSATGLFARRALFAPARLAPLARRGALLAAGWHRAEEPYLRPLRS